MKKVIFLSVTVLIIVFFTSSSFAAIPESESCKYQDSAFGFASRISENLGQFSEWKEIVLENEKNLYDYTGSKINAVSYEVSGKDGTKLGYIIVDTATRAVVEFSKNESPYGDILEDFKEVKGLVGNDLYGYSIYYPGHHLFAVRTEDSCDYRVLDFTRYQALKMETKTLTDKTSMEIVDSHDLIRNSGEHYKLLSGVPDANYTIRCIPTAIGNIIGYWDTHGYPNLIISPNTIYSAITEVNNNLIIKCGNNVTNDAIPDATRWYCRAAGRYPNRFNVTNIWNPSYAQYKSQIDNNRPALVGFTSAGPYSGAHMTAGVGYYYDDWFPQYKYVYVHDAWSSTPVNYFVLWGSYNDFIATIIP
jgi:hypothetical protein